MKKKYKIIKSGIAAGAMIASLITSGCSMDVECNVNEPHAHMYVDKYTGLSKYILGEKEQVSDFVRQEQYSKLTDDLKIICEYDLCTISDNKENFYFLVDKMGDTTREEFKTEYVYGYYVGWGFGYNPMRNKYEYFFGGHTGYHWESDWKDISLDEYTDNPVRDTYYKIRLYKISDGKLETRLFDSVDEIDEEYNYFNENYVVERQITDEYYLSEKNKGK